MGIRYQSVIDGEERALRKLAEIGEAQPDELTESSVIRLSPTHLEYRRQQLRRHSMRRARLHICPQCLGEDIAASNLPANLAVHGRATWMVAAIRTCRAHHVKLVEVARDMPVHETHDWAANVAPAVARLKSLVDAATPRRPSGLERYLLDRFGGQSAGIWLDTFPFYAASHMTEIVGAVAAFGKEVNLDDLSDDQKHEAGRAGFELAKDGPAGIKSLMDDLHRRHVARQAAADGPQAVFGKLYVTFAHGSQDPAFDPLRQVMTEQILDNFPLGPGDLLFGNPVSKRRCHSIRSASLQYKMHPKRLRRLVAAQGLIADPSYPDNRILFTAETAERIYQRERQSLTMKQAETYINAGRVQTRILFEAGLIRRHKLGDNGLEEVFFRAELDEFLARLLKNAKEISTFSDPVHDLPSAAKRACCSSAEIVKLILDERLQWVGRRTGQTGFLCVLVDTNEVKAKTALDAPNGMPLNIAAKEVLKTNWRVMSQLVASGAIQTTTVTNPVNRCPQCIIPFSELQRFQRTYVSLHRLGIERGLHMRTVLKELNASGILPAAELNHVGATFYRREHLAT
jgi:hypothetical protein